MMKVFASPFALQYVWQDLANLKRDQMDNPRPQDLPPLIHVARDGQAVYEVNRIVGWRERSTAAEFEVKWTGQDHSGNTWEPYTNITRHGGKTTFR